MQLFEPGVHYSLLTLINEIYAARLKLAINHVIENDYQVSCLRIIIIAT